MANEISINVRACCSELQTTFIVEDPLSAVTTGSTIQIGFGETISCYEVLEIRATATPANAQLIDVYTSCESCLSGITTAVQISTCSELPEIYFIDITSFTTLPEIDSIVYLETVNLEPACFTIDCYVIPKDGSKFISLISMSNSYTGCTECILNNFTTYEVIDCIDSNSYYIGFPPGFDYTNYLVSFEVSLGDVFCGTVAGSVETETNANLISILGTKDEVKCEQCLSAVTETRIITNCLTQEEQVVYGSLFYEGNEVTNLSTNDGCFEVGDLTESAVTINTFLNFDPQPDCQECIQCSGVIYEYLSCTNSGPIISLNLYEGQGAGLADGTYGPFETTTEDGSGVGATVYVEVSFGLIINVTLSNAGVGYSIGDILYISQEDINFSGPAIVEVTDITTTGSFLSYQYVQDPIGKTTYIPYLDDCVEITSVSNDFNSGYNYTLFSFDVFNSCSQCELSANNYFIWLTQECETFGSYVVVLNSNSYIADDYVKAMRGTTEFQCYKLIQPYDYTLGNIPSYISNTTTPFDDCETCNSGTLIGASIAKCGGGGQQFVNIPITTWNQMAYFDSQSIFVLETYGQCYGLLNTCPLEPNYTTIYPIETYYNCIECSDDNTRFPRSANTESHICVVCCPCGGTGSTITQVSPPHPVWTDAYGTPVTQMNMITLGGPNGLNN
jgi:hypothetical protein